MSLPLEISYSAPTGMLRFYPVVEVEQLHTGRPATLPPGSASCLTSARTLPGVVGSRLDIAVNATLPEGFVGSVSAGV